MDTQSQVARLIEDLNNKDVIVDKEILEGLLDENQA